MSEREYRFADGGIELVVSVGDGLRITRFGFAGSANLLADAGDRATPTAYGPWRPLGGHRLWVAPESMPGSYAPDMVPVTCDVADARSGVFTQPVDASGIEKQIAITLTGDGAEVMHRIVNRGAWPIQVAPWAISIVAGTASAFIPQPPFRSHDADFLPARSLVQWSYTNLADPRWTIGPRLIRVTPDAARSDAQKIGAGNALGWCAVHLGDTVWIKRFPWQAGAAYPDCGCNNELFTVADYLEVETLGPLQCLAPNGAATHREHWRLFRTRPCSLREDEESELLHTLAGSER